jgi:hypothetical protein
MLIGGFNYSFVNSCTDSDMQPNPSLGALEAVIGEDLSLGEALEPVQSDFEVCIKL